MGFLEGEGVGQNVGEVGAKLGEVGAKDGKGVGTEV